MTTIRSESFEDRNDWTREVTRYQSLEAQGLKVESTDLMTEEGQKRALIAEILDPTTKPADRVASRRLLADICGYLNPRRKKANLDRLTHQEITDLIFYEFAPALQPFGFVFDKKQAAIEAARAIKPRRGSYTGEDACLRCARRPWKHRRRGVCERCFSWLTQRHLLDTYPLRAGFETTFPNRSKKARAPAGAPEPASPGGAGDQLPPQAPVLPLPPG